MPKKLNQITKAIEVLTAGGIVAYPTEAVYGLGCDIYNQQAVEKILAIKQRSVSKGLICIAANWAQIIPLIENPEQFVRDPAILASWPGPSTWVFPASPQAPPWITGAHKSIAIRIPNHPIALALCEGFKNPIVSTSANRAGKAPITDPSNLEQQFSQQVDTLITAAVGDAKTPSTIIDAKSKQVLR